MLVTMRTDGSNFDGAKNRWGQTCPETKKCFAYGDDGSMPRFTPTNDPWTQASTNPLDWKPQLETNMFGFLSANGHTVPHFGNMCRPSSSTKRATKPAMPSAATMARMSTPSSRPR